MGACLVGCWLILFHAEEIVRRWIGLFLLLIGISNCGAAVEWTRSSDFSSSPSEWKVFGDTSLFSWNATEQNVSVTWDSSQSNSYFYLPLPMSLTRGDDFRFQFSLQFSSIEIGVDPLKPYTFEVSAGLINTTNAFNPALNRGSGINATHGPRNLVEFDYFPDSGFGATISPTIATADNQIAYSHNHPFELVSGVRYQIEMVYSGVTGTLTCNMIADGEPFGPFEALVLPANYTNLSVNAFAISSYNDAGQNPPQFSGSILATGTFDDFEITVYHHPIFKVERANNAPVLTWASEPGWDYQIESSFDLKSWTRIGEAVPGTGEEAQVPLPGGNENAFFRIRAERS